MTTVSIHDVSASAFLEGVELPLSVKACQVTMDSTWSPYIQAVLTVVTPAPEDAEFLDGRKGARVVVSITRTLAGQSRNFDLMVTDARSPIGSGETEVTLASDEAALQAWKWDVGVVDRAMADATVYPSLEDLLYGYIFLRALWPGNISRQVAPCSSWIVTSSLASLSFDYGDATTRAVITRTAAGTIYVEAAKGDALADYVTPGETYTYSCRFFQNVSLGMEFVIREADGTFIAATAATFSGWQNVSVTFTAPTSGRVQPTWKLYGGAAGNYYRVKEITLQKGSVALSWVSNRPPGVVATADADLSAEPDALEWRPGVSAWDYVEPLVQAAGLRLFCDETRTWRLQPADARDPGQVNISPGFNLLSGTDILDPSGGEWADSVVIRYRWEDSNGDAQEAYDTATVEGARANSLHLDLERPYPGPGAAAAILRRMETRGHRLELEAVSNYAATPGMSVALQEPGQPLTLGWVQSVRFRLPERTMQITSAEARDIPDSAWLFLPAGETWLDSPLGASWLSETI